MIELDRLQSALSTVGSQSFCDEVINLCSQKLSDGVHGDFRKWSNALDSLPETDRSPLTVQNGAVCADVVWDAADEALATKALLQLAPWRKGPFSIGGINIDTEWRSNLKWDRIGTAIAPLQDRRVLDVGSGNGYYALRMRVCGASLVIGVDPTLLFVAQFAAVSRFLTPQPVHILPLRLQELPQSAPEFDTCFSMGVLYHQRDPLLHLQQLRQSLRPAGELVLETLIVPGEDVVTLVPESRYARMRNVWHLPSRPQLLMWLTEAGFQNCRTVDESQTSTDEQRPTDWMQFESLAHALDPEDASRTVEGLPGPRRIVITCDKP